MILELLTWAGYLFVTFLVGIVTLAIVYTRWNYGVLEKTPGLPALMKPYFVGGSDPFFYKSVVCEDDIERVKNHGPIFGFYEGRQAHIYIADPDLIRLICIKDFDYFHNKRIMDCGHEFINEMMDILPYEKWKAVRAHFSPQLTTGKIRVMSFQMLEAIDAWMLNMKNTADGKRHMFDPRVVFTALTVDVIARCAFGTKINALDDPENPFMKYVHRMSLQEVEPSFLFTIIHMFPFLAKLQPFFEKEVMDFFGDVLKTMLASRRTNNGQKFNDFLDVMNEMIEKCSTDEEYKRLEITETTAMCQAMIFLLAGFQTTAITLTLMSFYLSNHPDIQDKLIQEVDEFYERHNGKMDHEYVAELVYLNAVMNETLRMHPALIRIERFCVKDWYHEPTGLKIRKGVTIQIPAYAVHYDEKNFPQPYEWKPERFLPQNKDKMNSYAFLSFGQGPHNCIGMRFAKEEIQMTMASLLKDFKFENPEGAKLKLKPGRLFLDTFEAYNLCMVRRN